MKPDKLLIEGLRGLGIELSGEQCEMFMSYLGELKRWNRAYSLTALRTNEDIVVKHFLDSCAYLKALPTDIRSVGDVGSGAGFPGLPIKIMRTDVRVYLIESVSKKCSFLRHMKRTLKLEGLEIIESRVEDVEGVSVDAAVTRALFKADEFVRRAGHIVREGGIFILSKGPKAGDELEGLGLDCNIIAVTLPVSGAIRNLVTIRKRT